MNAGVGAADFMILPEDTACTNMPGREVGSSESFQNAWHLLHSFIF
jgi:hypothetical protein